MDSSSDEEIRRLEQELKRKKEQKRRKKQEKLPHTPQPEENTSSALKRTDLVGIEDTPNKQAALSEDSHQIKGNTQENIVPGNRAGQATDGERNKTSSDKIFEKRAGTTDKGKKYEDLVTAKVALQLVSDSTIKDFYISSNDKNFGDFDDVVIEIETDSGMKTTALQLKHSNEKKQLYIKQLAGKKGDFSLIKYFKSAQEVQGEVQEFILFTTNAFKTSEETKFKLEGEEFYVKASKKTVSGEDFDVLRISENINYYHIFHIVEDEWTKQNAEKIQQYQTFFECFRLYTSQERFEALTKSTMDKFTEMFCSNEETFKKYVDVISEWSMRDGKKEKLSKRMMQRVIALRLLSSQIEPFAFGSVTNEMKILRDAICLFDITLLEKKGSNAVKNLWGDLGQNIDLKELNKVRLLYSLSSHYISGVENLDANLLTQLLWLMEKCPLIVKKHVNMEKAINLCPDAKFIILGEGKYEEWMKKHSVFQNLFNLKSEVELYEKVLRKFTISIQGKEPRNLVTAFNKNEEIFKHVTVKKLLEMANGPCHIDGQKEVFPNLYIDRYLSVNIIDIKFLEHVNRNTVIILNCEGNSQQLKISKKYTLTDIEGFLSNTDPKIFDKPIFIRSEKSCSDFDFQKICSKATGSKTVHCFKFLNNHNLEWIGSKGSVNELRNYKVASKNENEIWSSEFSNNINLITADPGMGKTELTKSLKNNCCARYWTVILSAQDVMSFFKNSEKSKTLADLELFEEFILNEKYRHLAGLDREFFKMCLKQRNVVYVWDALDEIFTRYLNATLDLILMFSQKDCIQWVTARQHLRSSLEEKFDTLSVGINQLSEVEQEDYIKKRLNNFIKPVDVKPAIDKIKSTFAFTKHIDILGIPLQIFMLTDVLLQNKEKYLELLETKFLLTDMYRYFIEGKFKFFYEGKVPVNSDYWEEEVRKKKEEKLKLYETLALKVIFPENILKQFNIDYSQKTDSVSEDFATVGVVTGLQNGIPQFVHASFAEYFVALHFSRNFEMIHRDIFFDAKYNNVRFFFDMLTGKNSPVHIAILNRNFDEVENFDDEIIKRKDECGRSALHIICSWGRRHGRLNVQTESGGYVIEAYREIMSSSSLETKEYFKALLFLLDKCEILEKDFFYQFTPFAWAQESESLGAELELLQTRKLQLEDSFSRTDKINILFFATLHGYAEAFKILFSSLSISHNEFDRSTPLIIASREGHEILVEYLAKYGAEINRADKYGWTLLYAASFQGHEKIVECLVKCGAEINRADEDGETPLYAASSRGHEKIVECLVKCGAEINRADEDGQTPLYAASSQGHEKIVECLVKCGAEINRADKDGRTPLYAASSQGHEKIVECLVKCGAEINRADKYGRTPLYAASSRGHEKIVECLVKCGAEINRADNYGQTPLYAASFQGHEKIVEFLVKCGAEINSPDKYGRTPLYAASSQGHEKIVECLVKCGAEINRANKGGETPLNAASSGGHEKIVECLVKCGAEINRADNYYGQTPLYKASSGGHEKIVECLVKCGAEINRANENGEIPLYAASFQGHEKIVEFLVKCGAEINSPDKYGRTPLYAASSEGHEKIVECLVKCGAEINRADNYYGQTPLYAASSQGHEKIVECLVKCGAEINRADNYYGQTPLYAASSQGHEKIVEFLVKCGAEINSPKKYGRTPLYAASSEGHEKIVECLVKYGAEINRAKENGETPLYAASSRGHKKIVEFLVKCGAEIYRADKDDRTPLHAPSSQGHEKIVECLVKYGAEINRADKDGWTPLHAASFGGHKKIVECLVKCGAEINRADIVGRTPLNAASSQGHEKIVECLVKCGAEINRANKGGETPLNAASYQGHEKIVESLVKSGTEINRANENGKTPLYVASSGGHEKIVECLVKCGAEINRANKDGKTPLYAASNRGREEIVECLVKCGAEINRANKDGKTPLYAASYRGREKIVECLVKCGAEINRANENGETPLYAASSEYHKKIVECLVKCGAEINRANENGETPLYAASSRGHEKIVECLVKCGAEINRANNYGKTPLYAASYRGREKIVECLVKWGAEINSSNKYGWTPLYAASSQGHEKIVECLVKCGAEINCANENGETPLYAASSRSHEKIVECLVKCGAEINRADNYYGQTPLYAASSEGHEKIVECLVKCGAEINRADNYYGQTPLYAASSEGHEKIVECLVKCGAEINSPNKYGWIPLYAASSQGHEKIVECLVKCGAEINRVDKDGDTPLHAASFQGHEKIVDCLVKCGAEINSPNKYGRTPLSVAFSQGHEKIVEWLVKCGAEINRADFQYFITIRRLFLLIIPGTVILLYLLKTMLP
ncbi:hypothetical protein Zmor_018850 [Zophobas morio]|uniref:Uncharacterized protein n=1 Tax=Zophobas morio TaxID=2755281 RepID=A0AA38MDT7_9CUCU|nr:hypothetical protein Zmor_018850 [Zophobas morio]